jgi:EmrB/QacA subfamily drug resistance transporter
MVSGGDQAPDPRRWRALAVCLAGGFMAMLDVSITNVALPSIQTALSAGSAQIQLIIAGYTLALALCVVPAGRLGDAFGRRRMFMVGVAGFGCASLLAGMSESDTMLAAARVAQGVCAGVVNPQSVGLIQQLFTGRERGRAFGVMGTLIGVATALGPVLGGTIIAIGGVEHGWRWIFFINVPIACAVVPIARKLLPDRPPTAEQGPQRLDVPGILLVGLTACCFMAPFILSGAEGGPALGPWRWWLVPASLALLACVAWWERGYQRRTGAAVFDPALLANTGFRFGAALGCAYFAGFTSVFLVVTMMLQRGLGYSALAAGFTGAPFALGSALAASVAGRLVGVYGRRVVVGSLTLALFGLCCIQVVLRFVPEAWLAPATGVAMFVAGMGSGSTISPNQTLTLAEVPVRIGSVAGGVLQVCQQLGSAIGMSIVLSGFFTHLAALGARGAAAHTLLYSMGLVCVALLLAVLDLRRRGGADAFASGPER